MMRCRSARRAIELEVDDRLSLDRRFQLEEHLEECTDCRELATRTRRIEDALLSWPEPPAGRIDVEYSVAAIRERLDAPTEDTAPANHGRRHLIIGLVAVAAATILILTIRGVEAPPESSKPLVRKSAETEQPAEESLARDVVALAAEATTPVPSDPPLDHERLTRTRAAVRQHLLDASAGLQPDAAPERVVAFVELFDVCTSTLR